MVCPEARLTVQRPRNLVRSNPRRQESCRRSSHYGFRRMQGRQWSHHYHDGSVKLNIENISLHTRRRFPPPGSHVVHGSLSHTGSPSRGGRERSFGTYCFYGWTPDNLGG